MTSTLAAIGDSWNISSDKRTAYWIAVSTLDYNWDPFYVLLWATLHGNFSDPTVQLELNRQFTTDLLDNAPCKGTYCYDDTHFDNNGWCTSYRWHSDNNEQEYGNQNIYPDGTNAGRAMFQGNYNGLDYMLYLNLYLIVTQNQSLYSNTPAPVVNAPEYPTQDMSGNIVGNTTVPVYDASPDTIISTTIFANNYNYDYTEKGNGTFKCSLVSS